jgi:hypothetical protein
MILRPGCNCLPRALGNRQRLLAVGGQCDGVQHVGDLVAEAQVVLFAARGGIPLVTGRRRVAIGLGPIDEVCTHGCDLQPGLFLGPPDRHRENHALVQTDELPVADENVAVEHENAEKRRF